MKEAYFIVDGLTALRANALKKALLANERVVGVYVNVSHALVKINYYKTNPEESLRMACSIIKGISLRVKVSKRQIKRILDEQRVY
jgi:hypothetical protein